ncbi:hypothetical protein BH10CYA1_BH10CYA1_06950 [soil metagenome]
MILFLCYKFGGDGADRSGKPDTTTSVRYRGTIIGQCAKALQASREIELPGDKARIDTSAWGAVVNQPIQLFAHWVDLEFASLIVRAEDRTHFGIAGRNIPIYFGSFSQSLYAIGHFRGATWHGKHHRNKHYQSNNLLSHKLIKSLAALRLYHIRPSQPDRGRDNRPNFLRIYQQFQLLSEKMWCHIFDVREIDCSSFVMAQL